MKYRLLQILSFIYHVITCLFVFLVCYCFNYFLNGSFIIIFFANPEFLPLITFIIFLNVLYFCTILSFRLIDDLFNFFLDARMRYFFSNKEYVIGLVENKSVFTVYICHFLSDHLRNDRQFMAELIARFPDNLLSYFEENFSQFFQERDFYLDVIKLNPNFITYSRKNFIPEVIYETFSTDAFILAAVCKNPKVFDLKKSSDSNVFFKRWSREQWVSLIKAQPSILSCKIDNENTHVIDFVKLINIDVESLISEILDENPNAFSQMPEFFKAYKPFAKKVINKDYSLIKDTDISIQKDRQVLRLVADRYRAELKANESNSHLQQKHFNEFFNTINSLSIGVDYFYQSVPFKTFMFDPNVVNECISNFLQHYLKGSRNKGAFSESQVTSLIINFLTIKDVLVIMNSSINRKFSCTPMPSTVSNIIDVSLFEFIKQSDLHPHLRSNCHV